MAGASITDLISSTIAILWVTTENYNMVRDDKGLREAFHEAGRGLLLVEEALQIAKTQLDARDLAGDPQTAMSSMEACNTKAKLSESIFKDVAQAPETSRFERYKTAVKRVGKENTIEVLVTGMMNDTCDLANDSAIEAAMKDQVKGLRDAIDKLSTAEPSVPKEPWGNSFSNSGSGKQFNNTKGTQYNSTDGGKQFFGNFSGSVTFS
ncbi:hypothetical protein DL764_008236 [Monosporascus ibericus]|uniref:NACHT-NTPase and P-loop NTPases N-terminal domain-containing protein n=1 Tax=Monosporascus ibericus TaxID=155417 RepID=A0A4Q4SY26_9PEZI|nr:hypothetical protein DL764_008236 [Monosporascus ibericus]